MTSTNRALNRVFLFVVGALLVTAGAAGIGLAVLPGRARPRQWQAPDWRSLLDHAAQLGVASIGIPRVPWFLLAFPVAAAVLIAALLLFVVVQGRGRLGRVADGWHIADSPADGFLSVDASVARDAIRQAARGIRGCSEPAVSAYRIKGEPALKVAVTVADGVDPASLVPALEAAIAEWDGLLGDRSPVHLQLTAGLGAAALAPLRAITARRREPSLME